jgi:hypothetical protein
MYDSGCLTVDRRQCSDCLSLDSAGVASAIDESEASGGRYGSPPPALWVRSGTVRYTHSVCPAVLHVSSLCTLTASSGPERSRHPVS